MTADEVIRAAYSIVDQEAVRAALEEGKATPSAAALAAMREWQMRLRSYGHGPDDG